MTYTDHTPQPLTADSPEWALRGKLAAHSFFQCMRFDHVQPMVDFMLQLQAEAAQPAPVQEPVALPDLPLTPYHRADGVPLWDTHHLHAYALRYAGMLAAAPVQPVAWQSLEAGKDKALHQALAALRGPVADGLARRCAIQAIESAIAAPPAQPAVPTFTDEHINYIARYGGLCRDCADENGICPSKGLPCGGSEKAIRHVLQALTYGIRTGHLPGLNAARQGGEGSET
jgi:hypothetical protein